MLNSAGMKARHRRFIQATGKPVEVMVNEGGYYSSASVTAHVSTYRESDLVPGGPMEVGDLKLIAMTEDMPRALQTRDKVVIEGRTYGVIHYDPETRSTGGTDIAVEVTVRG